MNVFPRSLFHRTRISEKYSHKFWEKEHRGRNTHISLEQLQTSLCGRIKQSPIFGRWQQEMWGKGTRKNTGRMRTGVFKMVRSLELQEKHNTPERECGRSGGWLIRLEQIMTTLSALGKKYDFILLWKKASGGFQQGMIRLAYGGSSYLQNLPGGILCETPANGPSSKLTPNSHQMLTLWITL